MTPASHPTRAELEQPAPLLRFLSSDPVSLDLAQLKVAEVWALAAVAALARTERDSPLRIEMSHHPTSDFAFAIGLNEVIENRASALVGEHGRTVRMTRVTGTTHIEQVARRISELLVGSPALLDTRNTIQYVLVELLRNVVQHSQDPLGGVVAAQRNDRGRSTNRPVIQVAVADAGIGIPAHLRIQHPSLNDAQAALDKALWPHISGAFPEGETGTLENAGMGLFFISEMTKLVLGRLLIASRGAALLIEGDETHEQPDHHSIRFLDRDLGFPGTLVAFEMPADEEQDYDAMIETIRERARARTPQRQVHRWIDYGSAPATSQRFLVNVAAEDTQAAQRLGEAISKILIERKPVLLDFLNITVCTQSFVHALLFQPLRLAWALKIPIHVVNAKPAVRSALELLENYALSG